MPAVLALLLSSKVGFELLSPDVLMPLTSMLKKSNERQALYSSLSKFITEIFASAAGGWGGRVSAIDEGLWMLKLPLDKFSDGTNDVVPFLRQAQSLGFCQGS